jgi:hypothetical protein
MTDRAGTTGDIPPALAMLFAALSRRLPAGALLLGIPVYLAQRRHLTPPPAARPGTRCSSARSTWLSATPS